MRNKSIKFVIWLTVLLALLGMVLIIIMELVQRGGPGVGF